MSETKDTPKKPEVPKPEQTTPKPEKATAGDQKGVRNALSDDAPAKHDKPAVADAAGAKKAHEGSEARDVKIDTKIQGQMEKRGWNEQSVKDTVKNPHTVTPGERDTRHRPDGGRNDDPATKFHDANGHYVVVNDKNNDVVQVSDKNKQDWKPHTRRS